MTESRSATTKCKCCIEDGDAKKRINSHAEILLKQSRGKEKRDLFPCLQDVRSDNERMQLPLLDKKITGKGCCELRQVRAARRGEISICEESAA
ncbi:hypothetical protein SKAU_G00266420 [Synaphobranchus kaupii]|uniref:Uncharacterized protein n=1 Tax=Synaphobranchus kaupii TaxID=118154 RepID=A0A9Q1EZF7_SYNKA|nr:hypothetical protein SKAU_G00266420 [Synaphobranchus kaupii]